MSLLLALSIFSGLFLIFNRWTTEQRKSAVRIFQEFQAIQIAENQAQRQFLGLSCENSVEQNGIPFATIVPSPDFAPTQCQIETDHVVANFPTAKLKYPFEFPVGLNNK